VLSAASAAALWLARQPRGGVALFTTPELREEFAGLDEGTRYVVIGDLGEAWDFAKLNRAFRLLMADPQSQLVALGMTRYWQTETGLSLDVAPFVAALEHATGRRAVVLGKPAKEFFLAGASRLGLPPEHVLMVGDDIRADVEGALGAGLKAALVKTGKFREADLGGDVRPDLVLDSVADLPGRWIAWRRGRLRAVKEVYVTRNPAEAHLVRGLLESAGIAAVVVNDELATGVGEIAEGMLPSVCVLDDAEAERALALVNDWLSAEPEAAPWECPKCGEEIDGRFTACWECGTERPSPAPPPG
jgi:HAD superfamily hydrolase (TIGR01458 family)